MSTFRSKWLNLEESTDMPHWEPTKQTEVKASADLPETPKTYGAAFLELMCWAAQYGDLRLERSGGVTLNPQPQHIRDALELYPWGVVYGSSKAILALWGDVPQRITDTASSPEAEDHEAVMV